jgi:hypothetical protein
VQGAGAATSAAAAAAAAAAADAAAPADAAAADAAAAGRAIFMHLVYQIMCARACPCLDSAGTGACYDGVELKGFAAPCADGSSCRDSGEEHAEKGRGKCG